MNLGANPVDKLYLGGTAVNRLYLGTNLVWEPAATEETERALEFNATAQLGLSSIITLNGDFTIEFWLKLAAGAVIDNDDGIVGDGVAVLNFHAAKVHLWTGSMDAIVASQTATDGVWEHHAITRGGSVMSYYKNGVYDDFATSQAWTGMWSLNNIGDGSNGFLNGQLDELRVWNVERLDTEIAANYNQKVDPASAGLLAYYRFNEEGTAAAADLTGNGYDTKPLPTGVTRVLSDVPFGADSGGGGGTVTYEQETNDYKTRVEADGGVVIDIDFVDSVYKKVKEFGVLANMMCWTDYRAGVKKDAAGKVAKLYSMDLTADATDPYQTTAANQPTYVDGSGVRYDGTTSLRNADTASLSPTAGITLMDKVYHDLLDQTMTYTRKDNAYIMQTNNKGSFRPHVYAGGWKIAATPNNRILATTWHNTAMTYDGAALKGFIDNAEVSSTAVTGPIFDSTNLIQYGFYTTSEGFKGIIASHKMFDKALTLAQMTDLNAL